jgi:hexosaminidase
MKFLSTICLSAIFALSGCKLENNTVLISIIPEPQEVKYDKGFISFSDTSGLVQTRIDVEFMADKPEAYELTIDSRGISITGNSSAGIFYGLNTLKQILPVEGIRKSGIRIPCVSIRDWPAFSWRGGMLDVSRHFFPKEFILKYIDILAFHKLNTFHWHLTDGTAWRLELDAFPELTENVDSYSKADIREIVNYANENHVRIIPEIEMPGHSDAALNVFPDLSCTPDHPVGIYCAGKEESFEFLEKVLDEVIALFPSTLIHIGGDEVGKGTWKACDDCQKRMADEGLSDEDQLQSYFITRIQAYLDSKDRELIGWDEILEGGLAPNAKVMSWRGMAGGIKASQMGHEVVMSPGYPCYFDHYQSGHVEEPQAWGGLNGIRDVYGFNPVPQEIPEEHKHYILGGQANLWTEQIATAEHAEYMMMPRYSALSEALWSGQPKKNWEAFEQKLIQQMDRYEKLGFNFARSAFTPLLHVKYLDERDELEVSIARDLNLYPVHYTMDGSIPTPQSAVYTEKLYLKSGESLKALTFREGAPFGFVSLIEDLPNKATGKIVSYNSVWEKEYAAKGHESLVDAQLATKRGDHPDWQGFKTNDLDIVIDLEKVDTISRVWINMFQHSGMTRVQFPESIEVYGSVDGKQYKLLSERILETNMALEAMIEKFILEFNPTVAGYVRIKAKNPRVLYSGHPREGMDAWLFADEVGIH